MRTVTGPQRVTLSTEDDDYQTHMFLTKINGVPGIMNAYNET